MTRQTLIALNNKNNAQAWMIAVLTRANKLPKLAEILITEKEEKGNIEQALKNTLKNLGRKKVK